VRWIVAVRRKIAWAVYRRLIGALEPTIQGAVDRAMGAHQRTIAASAAYAARYSLTGDLTTFEMKVFSQNGEDGVLAELAERAAAPHSFMEIGAGDGLEANCIALASLLGWRGVFVEGDPATAAALQARMPSFGPTVRAIERIVTPDNIDDLLREAGYADGDLGVLTIDVDSNDYWLWQAVTVCQPPIVVIEYNASFALDESVVTPLQPPLSWDGTVHFGSSLRAFEDLGASKGYRLVYTDLTGVNAFFVRDDVFEQCRVKHVPRRQANYTFWRLGHPDH
jgi:hypothetical protein